VLDHSWFSQIPPMETPFDQLNMTFSWASPTLLYTFLIPIANLHVLITWWQRSVPFFCVKSFYWAKCASFGVLREGTRYVLQLITHLKSQTTWIKQYKTYPSLCSK
jgi:hypothetical protein